MKFGPYEALEPIGRGASGEVFRARAPDGTLVAVKVISRLPKDGLPRFQRELELLVALSSTEGFVRYLDMGLSPSGPFLVIRR